MFFTIAWERFLYFIFGFSLSLFIVILLREKNVRKSDKKKAKFYVNVFCLNKSEAIKSVVKKKFSSAMVGRLIGTMAGRLVSGM